MSDSSENTITGLRSELFETIRALRDPNNPMDVNRARAVADVAGRVIDSVKAETDYVKAFGGRNAVPAHGFIPIEDQSKPAGPGLPGGESGDRRLGQSPRGSLR